MCACMHMSVYACLPLVIWQHTPESKIFLVLPGQLDWRHHHWGRSSEGSAWRHRQQDLHRPSCGCNTSEMWRNVGEVETTGWTQLIPWWLSCRYLSISEKKEKNRKCMQKVYTQARLRELPHNVHIHTNTHTHTHAHTHTHTHSCTHTQSKLRFWQCYNIAVSFHRGEVTWISSTGWSSLQNTFK